MNAYIVSGICLYLMLGTGLVGALTNKCPTLNMNKGFDRTWCAFFWLPILILRFFKRIW